MKKIIIFTALAMLSVPTRPAYQSTQGSAIINPTLVNTELTDMEKDATPQEKELIAHVRASLVNFGSNKTIFDALNKLRTHQKTRREIASALNNLSAALQKKSLNDQLIYVTDLARRLFLDQDKIDSTTLRNGIIILKEKIAALEQQKALELAPFALTSALLDQYAQLYGKIGASYKALDAISKNRAF